MLHVENISNHLGHLLQFYVSGVKNENPNQQTVFETTLNLFYKQQPVSETSRPKFDSGCLAVAYFGLKFG